jgi:hypothetical protein
LQKNETMPDNRKINITLSLLLVFSALIRGFVAGFIELGNDEVYYWTYARFPALSHFDHPPMVGLAINAFTLNLNFESEFFIRLASVILGTLSTWLIFQIGKTIKNPLTGLYAALLYTASFYGFVLCGTFILPDTPQVFFWLIALLLVLRSLPDPEYSPQSRNMFLFAGAAAGLALLSKYHAVFLMAGVFMYLLLYDRKWFTIRETWGAFAIFILLFMPVIFWNAENDFISFSFHENRVGITEEGIKPQYLMTEVFGQFFYNNPVNVVLIIAALVAIARRKYFLNLAYRRIILWTSLPLILLFIGFSLFRSTLPHWSGPGYLGLILITAAWLSEPAKAGKSMRLVPVPVMIALAFMLAVVTVAVGQIRYGWIPLQKWKADDVSLDLYGWEQLGKKFETVNKWDEDHFLIDKGAPIITFRWFPAANFDYYVGRPIDKPVYALGTLERIHKYQWINKIRGNLKQGDDAWFIALSDDYEDPVRLYGELFDIIIPTDTICITRGNDTVRKAFLFRMIDLKQDMNFVPVKENKNRHGNRSDTLAFFLDQIRADRQYLDLLEKRSVREGIPLDELIRDEAANMYRKVKEVERIPDTTRSNSAAGDPEE